MEYEKSLRSVFVGNIPYDVSDEKLREVFTEVGHVLSVKLVYDRETGKPKGYGFIEYKDQETAMSAMRNLNRYEIGGRQLRVDSACTERSRIQESLAAGAPVPGVPTQAQQYGPPATPEDAPESISKAVASLPPEQMFELMKQMKNCIQNNPQEARIMLNQNPQLAYALLQAQVVMKIVDPDVALSMLHKAPPSVPDFHRNVTPNAVTSTNSFNSSNVGIENLSHPTGNGSSASNNRLTSTDPRGRGSQPSSSSQQTNVNANLPQQLSAADPEKAQLIMQVMKLTDDQIRRLPAEQQQSIYELKKQIGGQSAT